MMNTEVSGTVIPELIVEKNQWLQVTDGILYQATGGQPASQRTAIEVLAEQDGLTVKFICYDNPYTAFNTYKDHNTDMWNQEVFELFIASGLEVPKRYLELEINPNNALFTAWVDNPDGLSLDLTMVPHAEAGVRHSVEVGENEWSGSFFVPFSLIGNAENYRLNFYRIALHQQPEGDNWVGDVGNSSYLCWNATLSGEEPAFHSPARFGILRKI